ncbi:hypothetical protein MNBD_ACTINO02-444 [hydrothermal vent metagenome]|uniref:Peptidase S9 prolyl oligopeptidase catalytic domain-containing protein n=1 Tax=hydrothermal vent metagenome TaxID=652676 RepID=A0A3B0SFZ6_9ZZZZ
MVFTVAGRIIRLTNPAPTEAAVSSAGHQHSRFRPAFQGCPVAVLLIVFVLVMAACSGTRSEPQPAETPLDTGTTNAPVPSQPTTTSTNPPRGPTGEISMTVDGLERVFTVVRPDTVGPGAPVVVLLHGGTRDMRSVLEKEGTADWVALSEEEGFILVAPNGVNPDTGDATGDRQHWNDLRSPYRIGDSDVDDVTFINRVVDWVIQNHGADASRVFVTGLSNGGMMTQRLLIESPETFAAGASFIASLPDRDDLVRPDSPIPLLLASATDDPLVPWDGGNVARRNRGTVASVADTRAWWIETNRAVPDEFGTVELDNTNRRDGCMLTVQGFDAGPEGARVLIMTMEGGGHSMPSTNYTRVTEALIEPIVGPVCRDADGATIAWDFFMSVTG